MRRDVEQRPARGRGEGETGLARGLLAALASLSRRRTLGGRTWIALVAFALIGIVTLQLGLLKLNGGIGRALEHEALLQRENAALSIENSELGASDRITSWAVRQGMELAPPAALHFLKVRPWTDLTRAAGALSTSIHASTTGSGEAPGGGSPTSASASAQQSTVAPVAPSASGEPSTTGSPTTPAPAEPSAAGSPATPASGESPGRASGEPARTSGESTKTPAGAPPSPSPTAPASSSPAEGAPAGGTRAGSSG